MSPTRTSRCYAPRRSTLATPVARVGAGTPGQGVDDPRRPRWTRSGGSRGAPWAVIRAAPCCVPSAIGWIRPSPRRAIGFVPEPVSISSAGAEQVFSCANGPSNWAPILPTMARKSVACRAAQHVAGRFCAQISHVRRPRLIATARRQVGQDRLDMSWIIERIGTVSCTFSACQDSVRRLKSAAGETVSNRCRGAVLNCGASRCGYW